MTLEVSKDNFKINSLSQNNSIFYIFEIKKKETNSSKIIRRIKNLVLHQNTMLMRKLILILIAQIINKYFHTIFQQVMQVNF